MEFYQKAETESEWNKMFQFPTGWNSAPIVHIKGSVLCPFKFPMGWNSTGYRTLFKAYLDRFQFPTDRLPAQFILINKVLDLLYQIYSTKARNLPRRINSAEFYFTLFISISPPCAPISIRSPVLISSLRIISAILSSTRS